MTGAIITGDIVASTKLSKPQLAKLLKTFSAILASYNYEFFRGDSVQVLVKPATEAYPLLLKLRVAALRMATGSSVPVSDLRASIGIGQIRLPVKTIRTASEEVFILSGHLFEQLKAPERLLIASPEKNELVNTGLHLIAYFTDYIFERMTLKQAEVVHELLLQKTQKEIAKTLKKSQATVNRHAQAAGWATLEKLMSDYQTLVKAIS